MEKRIVAQEFRLADSAGRVRAKIHLTPDGRPLLDAFDEDGRLLTRTDLSTGQNTSIVVSQRPQSKEPETITQYHERVEQEVVTRPPRLTVGGHKLVHDFQNSETEASARYMGEVVVVSGEIAEIQIREYGDTYVGLKGLSGFAADIVCHFTEPQRPAVGQLTVGQTVRIKGKVTEFSGGRVKLWGCRVD